MTFILFTVQTTTSQSFLAHVTTTAMMCSVLAAVVGLLPTLMRAFPIPPNRTLVATFHQRSTIPDEAQTGWSRQDIFTLVSVCVAVAGILIGLLLASPKLREWLCDPFKCKPNPNLLSPRDLNKANTLSSDCAIAVRRRRIRQQIDAKRRLQEEYNEYLEFQSFRVMRGSSQ